MSFRTVFRFVTIDFVTCFLMILGIRGATIPQSVLRPAAACNRTVCQRILDARVHVHKTLLRVSRIWWMKRTISQHAFDALYRCQILIFCCGPPLARIHFRMKDIRVTGNVTESITAV